MFNATIIYELMNSTIFGNSLAIIGILLSLFFGIVGIIGEYEFNIVSRLKKIKSHFRNEQAEIGMNFTYNPRTDFNLIKNELESYFIENYPDYQLHNEKTSSISISFDIFTMKITHNEFNEIFFDVIKTGCGIRDLNDKVRKLISTFDEIDRTKRIFDRLKSCEITLYLPHNLSYVKIYPPKGFTLEDYSIKIQDHEDRYRTKVDVCLNHINASGHSFEEIRSLLQKLL